MSEQLVRKATKNELYFCIFCFGDKLFTNKIECESHLREKHFIDSKTEERNGINLWIERHLKYQESLSKSMSESIKTIPDRSKTLYRGCLMCDIIMKVYDIRDDPYSRGRSSSLVSEPHEITIRDINIHYSGNNVNHINPHLRYYPYECLKCEEEYEKCRKSGDLSDIKDRVKTAVKPMMRIHVKDKHFKDSTLDRDKLEEQIDRSIRTLKVTELEKITKKQQNIDEKMKPKKRKSIPGPMRETKLDSLPPTKRLRPIVPIYLNKGLIGFKNSEQTDPKNKCYITFTNTQLPKTQTTVIYRIEENLKKLEEALNKDLTQKVNENKLIEETEILSSSEESISDPEDESTLVFVCVFCHKKFKNYDKAFDHYLIHCNIFIECAKCDLKFTTTAKFRSHNASHNEISNLLNLNNYKVIRKWIEKFLNYLTEEKEVLIKMTRDVTRIHCPVCIMMSNVFDIHSKSDLIKDETVETHIHQHFNYFPYECIDCNYEDIKTEFCLDSNAVNHLIDKHDIRNANDLAKKELRTYFDNKSSSISKFDYVIKECVEITHKIRSFWEMNSKDEPLIS